MYRSAALRLPLRASSSLQATSLRVARTYATSQPVPAEDGNHEPDYPTRDLVFTPMRTAAVPHGVQAFEWNVPKELPETDFLERRKAVSEHAAFTTELWRKISFYIAVPGCIVCGIWVYFAEQAHEEHKQHLIEENGGEPERKVYAYMNIRTKPFPWGNQSLFFNEKTNIPAE